MGLFRKNTNTRKIRNGVTRKKRNGVTRKKRNGVTRKKTRSSRKRRGGESSMKGTPSLSDSMKRTFPMVTKFPSCQRCMDAMDSVKTVSPSKNTNTVSPSKNANTVSPSKNANTVSPSNQPYEWTDDDIYALGEPNSNSNSHNSDKLSPFDKSLGFKTHSPMKNPYRTGGPGPQ